MHHPLLVHCCYVTPPGLLLCCAVCCLQIADPTKLDAIFVAIGGGGLIAGIAAYVKALHPHIKVRCNMLSYTSLLTAVDVNQPNDVLV
jgi:threonine dehydratase